MLKKNIKISILLVLAIFIVVYFSGVLFYKDRFLSNVSINNTDVGGKTLKNADKELGKIKAWDKIIIKSDSEEFLEIKTDNIDYNYIETPDLPKILDEQNSWQWFSAFFKDSAYSTPILYEYNEDKVKSMIDSIKELDKKLLNAKVVYSDKSNGFVIEPHSYEIKISKEGIFDLVAASIENRDSEVNLEKHIEQPEIFEDDKLLGQAKDKANKYLTMQIKYDFEDREEVVDRSILKDLIVVNEREVEIDRDKTIEYVSEIARKYDTYGKSRQFKTTGGKTINTNGGTYGWMTHRGKTADELIEHIKAGENKTIEPVYSYSVPIRKSDDIGNSYIEIDLTGQMVYVYINGALKVKTPTVTGNSAKGYDTPAGVYPVNYKETDATLRGEDYASPVKYWIPFNGHIGLHDADWRDNFGGEIFKTSGSHGCINLPPSNAKSIFDLAYPGMPVIVY